ncbi:MAG: aminodeoxychorismate/anthranilate synthase component II [Planctomycetota bacterium]|jgi:anthranilate synthase/aminodeoxychorismate synthase-like glutamine amidotransferase|nr:aminodeoxychorismate/anthranilate synthase component II [Planctomycetota bacterium]
MLLVHLIIVDNYDSFTHNLAQAFSVLKADISVFRNDEIELSRVIDMAPDGVIISPGPGGPEEAGISLDLARGVPEAGIPLLGVCLGHQCLARAFGARIIQAQELVHGKARPIHHLGHNLFRGIPTPFPAARYHSLMVETASIPEELTSIAWNDRGECMALAHQTLPAWGIQFHPESFLTPHGPRCLENFIQSLSCPATPRYTHRKPTSSRD